MTREHIIGAMARAAIIDFPHADVCFQIMCQKVPGLSAVIRDAVIEECAKACDWHEERQHTEGTPEDVQLSYSYASRDCAAAIRDMKGDRS